ncbi:Metallophos domain-containing protein [Meloidogyne graminicola]|uniref:Tartrate-resistant acid phosphatase type 5 n=1 Tax=Meloidogyne graminicola TaxID=189291 RepID=A0A8T0A2T4_9BILA|nr:Metallophos domain-containing protein [Meloidogyne graminicola]
MKKRIYLLLLPLFLFSFLFFFEEGEEKTFRIRLTPNGRLSCIGKKGCSFPKVKKLNFVLVGDIGGLPIYPYFSYAQKRVAEAIAKITNEQEEPLNFVINVGDNFYFNGVNNLFDNRFEDSFEQVYEDSKLLVPWFTIAGNHDHLGNISAQLAHTNFSSKWTFPHLFYKIRIIFDYQNITEEISKPVVLEILMLDTIVLCGNTEDVQGKSLFSWLFSTKKEPNGPEPEYEELAKRQWKWIEKQLKNSDADYLFVAGHYPIYSTCEHGGFQCLQKLDSLLHKFGVNAYFCGHDHNLQHIKIIKENIDKNNNEEEKTFVNYIVSGAASRSDRSAKHLNDIPEDSLLFRYPTGWNPFSQIGFSNGGFVQIFVERDQSEINFFDGKSRKRYSFKILPRKK